SSTHDSIVNGLNPSVLDQMLALWLHEEDVHAEDTSRMGGPKRHLFAYDDSDFMASTLEDGTFLERLRAEESRLMLDIAKEQVAKESKHLTALTLHMLHKTIVYNSSTISISGAAVCEKC